MSYKKVLAARAKSKKAKEPVQHLYDGGPVASYDVSRGGAIAPGGIQPLVDKLTGMPAGTTQHQQVVAQSVLSGHGGAGAATNPNIPGLPGINNPLQTGFHANAPGLNTQDLTTPTNTALSNIYGAGGINDMQMNYAEQLRDQANGQMSPAQQMLQNQLAQQTQQNIALSSGQLASARGMNPAIAARLAAENAGMQNQQLAAQGANLGLGFQQNAQNAYGNVLGQIHNEQNTGLNTLITGNNGQNQAINTGSLGAQGLNSNNAIANLGARTGALGGLLNAGGGILGSVIAGNATTAAANINAGNNPDGSPKTSPDSSGAAAGADGGAGAGDGAGAAGGEAAGRSTPLAYGAKVPGKAPYPGNDLRNDTVKAKLSPGEIVLPRSITEHPDAPHLAYEFVRRTLAGKGPKPNFKMAEGGFPEVGTETGTTTGNEAAPGPPAFQPADEPTAPPGNSLADWLLGGGGPGGNSSLLGEAPALAKKAVLAVPGGTWQQGMQRDPGTMDGALPLGPDQVPSASALPKVNVNAQGLPQGPRQAGGADPYAGVMDAYNNAFGQQEAGIKGMAGAAQKEAAGQAAAYQNYTTQMQGLEQRRQAAYAGLDRENAQLSQAFASGKIDPNRIWGSASTGNKVAAAIGIALSGIGSGLTGQPNLAMGIINKTIDQDIEAQKADLGKKQTLLSMNLQKYGRLDAAYSATSAQMHAVLQGQIGMEAAKAGGGKAAANAQMLLGQLGMQRAGQQQQVAMWNAFNQGGAGAGGGQGGGGTPGVDANKLRIGIAGGFIPKDQVGSSMKEYGDYHKLQGSLGSVEQAFQKVNQLETLGERLGSPLQSRAQIDATKKIFSAQLAKDLEGRATPQDFDSIMANFPDLKDSPETINQKRMNLQNSIKSKYSFPTLHTYGLLNQNDPTIAPVMSLPGARKIQGGN